MLWERTVAHFRWDTCASISKFLLIFQLKLFHLQLGNGKNPQCKIQRMHMKKSVLTKIRFFFFFNQYIQSFVCLFNFFNKGFLDLNCFCNSGLTSLTENFKAVAAKGVYQLWLLSSASILTTWDLTKIPLVFRICIGSLLLPIAYLFLIRSERIFHSNSFLFCNFWHLILQCLIQIPIFYQRAEIQKL